MPTALVTGSSRGIGQSIAQRFADDGYDIIVNYLESDRKADMVVRHIRDKTSRDAVAIQADVSDPAAAERLINAGIDHFGQIDHLVNNAGIDQHLHTPNLSVEDFDQIMNVNVNSAFAMTKAVLPYLQRSDDNPSIINISSILALTGAPVECHYAASKASLIALTKSHAQDFAPQIRVNAIAPGHIETDMTADRSPSKKKEQLAEIPIDRFGRPKDIGEAASFLRDATFVTGETLNVNGGELMR